MHNYHTPMTCTISCFVTKVFIDYDSNVIRLNFKKAKVAAVNNYLGSFRWNYVFAQVIANDVRIIN